MRLFAEGLGNALASAVSERADAFVSSAARELRFTRTDSKHEVENVVRLLASIERMQRWIGSRNPVCAAGEEVAILLPYNVVSWGIWRAACVLVGGNRVRIRMSRRAELVSELVREVMAAVVPDSTAVDQTSGEEFIAKSLASERIPLVIAYGSERLGDELLDRAKDHPEKKVIFEGPGKDPMIVLEGADLGNVVSLVLANKFSFSGQACIAPEILLIHSTLHDELVDRLATAFMALRIGDPADPDTQVGPMGSSRVPMLIREQLAQAKASGAEVVCGGDIEGDWVKPTLVVGVTPTMSLFQEESFGPVLGAVSFENSEDAIALASSTRFGLNCVVVGPGGESIAERLRGQPYAFAMPTPLYGRFGTTTANPVLFSDRTDPFRPFGGYGKSGWIWDRGQFLQGPTVLAREATRD